MRTKFISSPLYLHSYFAGVRGKKGKDAKRTNERRMKECLFNQPYVLGIASSGGCAQRTPGPHQSKAPKVSEFIDDIECLVSRQDAYGRGTKHLMGHC